MFWKSIMLKSVQSKLKELTKWDRIGTKPSVKHASMLWLKPLKLARATFWACQLRQQRPEPLWVRLVMLSNKSMADMLPRIRLCVVLTARNPLKRLVTTADMNMRPPSITCTTSPSKKAETQGFSLPKWDKMVMTEVPRSLQVDLLTSASMWTSAAFSRHLRKSLDKPLIMMSTLSVQAV